MRSPSSRPKIAEDRAPRLWASISEWISKAESLTFDDAAKGARFAAVDFARLRAEAAECEAVCSDAVRSPVVFCHNDLLAPNVLVVEGEGGAASGCARDLRSPKCFHSAASHAQFRSQTCCTAQIAPFRQLVPPCLSPAPPSVWRSPLHLIDFEYGGYNCRRAANFPAHPLEGSLPSRA